MKVVLGERECLVEKEPGDAPVSGESCLLVQVKRKLQEQGYDVVKKPMWRDGHLVSADQRYIRARDWSFCVLDADFAIRDSAQAYNRDGRFVFMVVQGEAW